MAGTQQGRELRTGRRLRHEAWRPPLLHGGVTPHLRLGAALRRWFDFQAGSIWRDLKPELRRVNGRLVDIGCGGQPYRGLLPADVEYLGIDSAEARSHFGYDAPDTVYYSGDRWPVDDAWADVVLMSETLEHVYDVRQFLAEARRCLRSQGRLLLTVPFAARWHFIPHDYWRFTPSTLERLLTESGFEEIDVRARGNAVTVACYKVMALMLPFLLPSSEHWMGRLLRRVLGLMLLPLILVTAAIANCSLRMSGGDDCLGYTVTARANMAQSQPMPM